jgi:hydroxymethylpyrimidine pyrophosphatase-like HAD family hydrolase
MALSHTTYHVIEKFISNSHFEKSGCLVLDLDGTALLEAERKVFISGSVERGIKEVDSIGRPVVINTLRFPLSVIRTIGEEWYRLTDNPIPTVLLNGSLLGYIRKGEYGLEYDELAAFPMNNEEIDGVVDGLEELMKSGIHDLVLFYYPRDWKLGEMVWTPEAKKVEHLEEKYRSATDVFFCEINELRQRLKDSEACMSLLLVDRPEDKLMAYQHSKRSSFFTHVGVDKSFGLRELADKLDITLKDSFGAGDTEMDTFLSEIGLAVIVGNGKISYEGTLGTVRVKDPLELGSLIGAAGQIAKSKLKLITSHP